jgi:hypothetical protein
MTAAATGAAPAGWPLDGSAEGSFGVLALAFLIGLGIIQIFLEFNYCTGEIR